MDLQTQLDKNMEKIVSTFSSTFTERMSKYEKDLKAATTLANPPDIAGLSQDFSEFKSFVMSFLDILKNQLELLTRGLDKYEMGTRRKVLLVHGVPEETAEDPGNLIGNILRDKLEASSECQSDIRVVHRLGAKGTSTRPLLVRFASMKSRQEVWDLKKKLKGTGITVSEFLTKSRHDVFIAARKHFGMANVWSTDGRIVLILPDKKRQKLECMAELQPLINKFPVKETPLSADKGNAAGADGAKKSVKDSMNTRRAAAAAKKTK